MREQEALHQVKGHMEEELSAKLEDYLEAIYGIEREKRVARPRDICKDQNVAGSTATAALQSLAEKRLINVSVDEIPE
jgi:DtxR family Mn-dependent transcriptional regulator